MVPRHAPRQVSSQLHPCIRLTSNPNKQHQPDRSRSMNRSMSMSRNTRRVLLLMRRAAQRKRVPQEDFRKACTTYLSAPSLLANHPACIAEAAQPPGRTSFPNRHCSVRAVRASLRPPIRNQSLSSINDGSKVYPLVLATTSSSLRRPIHASPPAQHVFFSGWASSARGAGSSEDGSCPIAGRSRLKASRNPSCLYGPQISIRKARSLYTTRPKRARGSRERNSGSRSSRLQWILSHLRCTVALL